MSHEAFGEPGDRLFPKPCMGGWCALRDHCQHYHAEMRGSPSERLCIPGRDGVSDVVQIRAVRPERPLPSQQVNP